ncbi:tRNA-dihydrouridine synthase [Klebsiella pneumoniae subsp. pneumoniae]|nr:tRNA-dihydrouridine synthase [Klebsiella pneumoniae subsp. pneumoniae]
MTIFTSPAAVCRRSRRSPLGRDTELPFARDIRQQVAIPVIGVGLITDPQQAEAALENGDADLIALARAVLHDPHWPWHAAASLGAQVRCAVAVFAL